MIPRMPPLAIPSSLLSSNLDAAMRFDHVAVGRSATLTIRSCPGEKTNAMRSEVPQLISFFRDTFFFPNAE